MKQQYLERKIENDLRAWKESSNRKPLIISGARQTGKTSIALNFGKKNYVNSAYFNFESASGLKEIFKRDLNPQRIITELSAMSGVSILSDQTLILFDEIQVCEQALTSLKYFCENAPEFHIIATGSLLGVALNREDFSFPVGKVDMLHMLPLDFEEFLWALGKKELALLIREAFANFTPLSLHAQAMEYYRLYLALGGMPEAIVRFLDTNDFNFVRAVQQSLNNAYIADMAKYANSLETTKILAAFNSVPAQLAKDNKKFQYKTIKSGARAKDFAFSLDWLEFGGVINKCVKVKEGKIPLTVYADESAFKVYMADTGLLCSKLDISPRLILSEQRALDGFKGALAENYVCQALIAAGLKPYYWESDGKAEVDFVFQDSLGNVVPLECKSAENVRAKSLAQYMQKYDPTYTIRVSAKNFGFENGIKSLPLYAVYCLKEDNG